MQLEKKVTFSKITNDLDMKMILRVNYYRIGVVLDYDCPHSEIVFEEFSKHQLPFNESYHWLVLTSTTTIPTQVLSNLPLSVESELTIANREENSYVLYDVYNPSYRHNGQLNVTFKGTWTTQKGLEDEMTQYKYTRRGNFHGLTLNFSFVLTNPPLPDFETYMTRPTNRHLDTMMRFHYAIVRYLRDAYNFTMNLKQAPTWGYFVNGTWNGILKDMIDGVTDISIAPFQQKANRMEVCEFTLITYIGRVVFIFRHPKKNTLRNPFLKPFTSNVWYSIAALSIVCYAILLLLTKVEAKLIGAEVKGASSGTLQSEVDLVVVGAISQQGINAAPNIISGRILFISLFLWGLLLYQFYSASIVGSLLAEEAKYITTLEQLDASNMELGIEEMPYYPAVFKYGGSPVLLRMYDEKMRPTPERPKGAYTSAGRGLSLVKKGGYALSIESGTAYKIIEVTLD
ncbi:ionotropic receptor 75a-like [Venturia canescens]|uniref:ionotropic receptor 75a-like n=1 Tax=Venturia canescens TaxID=32260 RepID=UPI001C9CD8F0|nr:ionotropic receptor 75a-like [Venturia canescens]